MNRATLRIALAASVLTLAGGASWLLSAMNAGTRTGSASVANVQLGGPFRLTDHTGRRVSDTDFHGRFMLIYFGYAYCPDVCPTELANIAAALDILGDRAERVVPILITLDPGRDTPEALADYVPLFHERFVGLTGTEAEIAAVAKAYSVFYRKVADGETTDYLLEHTTFIYLMDADGGFAEVFRYGTAPAEIAAKVREHLAAAAPG